MYDSALCCASAEIRTESVLIYVMNAIWSPFSVPMPSYRCCARLIVSGAVKPSLLEDSCCIEEVVNGAGAWLFTTDFFIAATTNSPAFSAASTVSVSSLEAGLYFLPFFFSREALNGACFSSLSCSSAETFQYSCGLNASISRSLSTISFSATDCTLPPESVRELFSVSILWFSRVESL